MAETQRTKAPDDRNKSLHTSRSFTRMDPPSSSVSPRKRASTLQEGGFPSIPEARDIDGSADLDGRHRATDVFENRDEGGEQAQSSTETPGPELQLPSTFDELPIEIKSLTERFLENLSAKVHPQPLSADALSELFQDFYEQAALHIATHIASLSSRIGRNRSPASSTSAKSLAKGRPRAGSGAKRTEGSPSNSGGEMLTATEVADRKRARRLLELKRIGLEEAVERTVTEKVYERIWKHRSTDDDARDGKLRSRTAALALVGIGLKELHMDSDPKKAYVREAAEEKEDEIDQSLAAAREALQQMDGEHCPLGKLQHLTAAHKSIVETLSQLFPSSSSADEILPTLIYTLITSPPESLNVVSNLNFIQRFRASRKVDGEAAYCLVNLEAAIAFVETVDLSSLRADELPEGPPRSNGQPSGPPTPTAERTPLDMMKPAPIQALIPDVSPISAASNESSRALNEPAMALPSPRTPTSIQRPPLPQRRISALMQAQADKIEAGRENFLTTADKIYDSINGTLENSLQFVFGRFKDQTSDNSPLPKTLEDARKLVSSSEDEEAHDFSGRSSPTLDDPLGSGKTDNKMLELISGRGQIRDRSVDSARSGGSGKRVAFSELAKERPKDEPAIAPGNLFATINPLNRFNVPGFARFSRAGGVATPTSAQPSPPIDKNSKLHDIVELPASARVGETMPALEKTRSRDSTATTGDDLNSREALAELRKLKPPRKRFLDVQNASELKLGEVEDLLMEYRRLAKAIGEAIAS